MPLMVSALKQYLYSLSKFFNISMSELLVTFMVASVMGAVITSTGILDVLAKNVLLKFIKNRTVLVFVTLVYCYVVNFLTAGGQTVSIIVTEQTFESTYEDFSQSII